MHTQSLLRINRLRPLKHIPLLQPRPRTHAPRLDADHAAPAVLGLKVAHAGGLVGPGVPDDHVGEVVADEAEARGAVLRDGKGRRGRGGGGVDAVGLGGEGYGARLGLCGGFVQLVDEGGGLEAGYLGGFDVLGVLVTLRSVDGGTVGGMG